MMKGTIFFTTALASMPWLLALAPACMAQPVDASSSANVVEPTSPPANSTAPAPTLLSWIEQPSDVELEKNGCYDMANEETCGTLFYCLSYDATLEMPNDKKYTDDKACFDAHEEYPQHKAMPANA
ncbi:hypothetical protein JDV02_009251 [Purpureocillium takamizusanense]|uniref:Uncharacterized protein n=1 Tax=Purpureocillium takamizusanense TaxID=2060973 RepID=A0A9Q8VFA0_9HYPO|nr:uncharacterized protein JDV02_009251 [Purpureocillium takamizusanense]UNI23433.1 hypothetical protein JDV02_009251 [Purpureocillium takamizusanense]